MRDAIVAWIDTAAAAVELWPLDPFDFSSIAGATRRQLTAARASAFRRDWSLASADELHELRQRVVDLRYQMELIEPLWPRFGRMWTEEAERLRGRLGQCQDLEVLKRLTGLHQPLAHWRSNLTPAADERSAELAQRAAQIAVRLFAEKPKAFRAPAGNAVGQRALKSHRRRRADPEINLPHLLVVFEIARRTFERDAPGLQHIGIVGDAERQRDRLLGQQ